MELCTVLAPQHFLAISSCAAVFKGVAAMAAGATTAAIHKSFAINENMGDVTAKTDAQRVGCSVVGTLCGIGLSIFIGTSNFAVTGALFGTLCAVHLFANWKSLRALNLRILNGDRLALIVSKFVSSSRILSPAEINQQESLFSFKRKSDIFDLHFGATIECAVSSASEFSRLVDFYHNEKYLLNIRNEQGRLQVYVVVRQDATAIDNIKILLQVGFIRSLLQPAIQPHSQKRSFWDRIRRGSRQDISLTSLDLARVAKASYDDVVRNFDFFIDEMKRVGWEVHHVATETPPKRFVWDTDN
eukprot:TRINITY_DN12824_c0_g1_i2.p1 TRINITY_DN12824_c0_g1~~TRINITY_DN12824_c0_g1_i2.p1  ORF type:complete len:301 (-),score=38.73 TRINITY_DN12824_c0_g1_i2:37-939(-)